MSDVFLAGVVDLFGDPVPTSRGKKGRPAHVPTTEFRRFVQLSLACGKGEDEIAAALRITVRTLNRHYFHELSGKAAARLRLEMKNLDAIVRQVEAGKTSAMSLLARVTEKLDRKAVSDTYQRQPTQPVLGKKEAARIAAKGVTGKYAPRPTLN